MLLSHVCSVYKLGARVPQSSATGHHNNWRRGVTHTKVGTRVCTRCALNVWLQILAIVQKFHHLDSAYWLISHRRRYEDNRQEYYGRSSRRSRSYSANYSDNNSMGSRSRSSRRRTDTGQINISSRLVVQKKKKVITEITSTDEEQEISKSYEREYADIIDEIMEKPNTLSTTGSICSSISILKEEGSLMFKSADNVGLSIIDFKIYPYGKCLGKEKRTGGEQARSGSSL